MKLKQIWYVSNDYNYFIGLQLENCYLIGGGGEEEVDTPMHTMTQEGATH